MQKLARYNYVAYLWKHAHLRKKSIGKHATHISWLERRQWISETIDPTDVSDGNYDDDDINEDNDNITEDESEDDDDSDVD